jgi:hypothetical protein
MGRKRPVPKYSTPYTGPIGHVDLTERRRICERIVGAVEWNEGGIWGYCTCPGVQNHSNANGRRDCRVYAEETPGRSRTGGTLPPGVTCLHTSCGAAIEAASYRIRSEIGRAKVAAAADPRVRGSGIFRAVENARAGARDNLAQPPLPRTVRTPVFKFSEKGASSLRTARTDISRPYALHAQAHTHTHVPAVTSKLPSEPSTNVAPKAATKPLPQQPKPAKPTGDQVFCPVRLVWITREQWAQELAAKPLTP